MFHFADKAVCLATGDLVTGEIRSPKEKNACLAQAEKVNEDDPRNPETNTV